MGDRHDHPFSDLDPDPEIHLELVLAALVLRLATRLRGEPSAEGGENALDDHPVVLEHLMEVRHRLPHDLTWDDPGGWWEERVARWAAVTDRFLPLVELGRRSGLGFRAGLAAVLVGCVESYPRLGAVVARIQSTPGSRRPTVSLVDALIRNGDGESVAGGLLRGGWLRAEDHRPPLAERHLRLSIGLWDVFHGRLPAIRGASAHPPAEAPLLDEILLPEPLGGRCRHLPAVVRRDRSDVVIVRGPGGSGRRSVARATARALERGVVEVVWSRERPDAPPTPPAWWEEIGPACALGRVLPLVRLELGPGETVSVPELPAHEGPVLLVLGSSGGVDGNGGDDFVHLELPHPGPEERALFWRRGLEGIESPDPVELGRVFQLTGGYILRAARLARRLAAMDRRTSITLEDVRAACGQLNRHLLEPLADRVEEGGRWEHLFVHPGTRRDLRDLELRCRNREALRTSLGPGLHGKLGRGVRALFTGSPGTGKTMAARTLAAELGMDLYRIDLSSVVDKYVGETEKRLEAILSRAEELDVILLLDEGDALMTGRTDVRSANDRYANLETNFLLQRLERYEGILVVTTNAASRLDDAFQRRFDQVVDFPPPRASERLGIWRTHLPPDHRVAGADLERVAARASLTGGQIRNAVLHATLLTLEGEGDRRVGLDQVEAAVVREFRKAGGAAPAIRSGEERQQRTDPRRRLDELVEELG